MSIAGRFHSNERLPHVVLLTVCLIAYVCFHAVRDQITFIWLKNSFPSLLTPLAMFGLIEFSPSVRYHSRRIKFLVLLVTTAFAALWLEGIVPQFTDRATGDVSDAVAMGLGFLLFWSYDSVIAMHWHPSDSACRLPRQSSPSTQSLREETLQVTS